MGVIYGWIGASQQIGASLAAFGAGAIRTALVGRVGSHSTYLRRARTTGRLSASRNVSMKRRTSA